MALTGPQTAKMAVLEAEVAELKKQLNESTTMRTMFGSYMFDKVAALEKQIKDVKLA